MIVVISDGEDHEGDIESVAGEAVEEGVVIHTVGIGSLSGAPIPVYKKGSSEMDFKKDRSGRIVTSALQEASLRQLASVSGGKYYNLELETDVFGKIYKEILGMEKKEIKSHEYSDYKEKYQIFLGIGLLLLLVEILIPEKIHREKEWLGRFE